MIAWLPAEVLALWPGFATAQWQGGSRVVARSYTEWRLVRLPIMNTRGHFSSARIQPRATRTCSRVRFAYPKASRG